MKKYSIILLLLMSSCVPKMQTSQIFSLSEVEAYRKVGSGIVKGQLFSRTRSGEVKSGAGIEVWLTPATPYYSERINILYKKCANPSEKINPESINYLRTVVADLQGNYIFEKVPAGKYFVTSILTWQVPSGYQGGVNNTGSRKLAEIDVKDNETINVNLTDSCTY